MLLGRAAFFRNTREDNAQAAALLQRAIRLDPNLARAYMNLAGAYVQQVQNGWALQETCFFTRRFEQAAVASEAIAEPEGWDMLYATLACAQLGRTADTEWWRSPLLVADRNFSPSVRSGSTASAGGTGEVRHARAAGR